jgi:hypothetical protein
VLGAPCIPVRVHLPLPDAKRFGALLLGICYTYSSNWGIRGEDSKYDTA